MQGCAQPRQGLPFDNPVQAKRSAGYENSKLNRMQYHWFISFLGEDKTELGVFPHSRSLSKMERGGHLPYRDGMEINVSFIFAQYLNKPYQQNYDFAFA
jgi:hypothetical protein